MPATLNSYGFLFRPALALPELAFDGGEARVLADFRGEWVYLVVGDGYCDQACERNIYKAQQVRWTQGEHLEITNSVFVLPFDRADQSELLSAKYTGTQFYMADRAELSSIVEVLHQAWTESIDGKWSDAVYLLDPVGQALLAYPIDADPSKMKEDLDRLLATAKRN